ncbi:hypothetical protein [Nonomuraea sp. SBT364]|uniref:hypothetical protein n=1 Tax=Nonomuraea sp. SBT364 TaxID=1580530 RepID=UPI0012E29508|nr:hypothetical protein [Nonomuraea sp. SBT364]
MIGLTSAICGHRHRMLALAIILEPEYSRRRLLVREDTVRSSVGVDAVLMRVDRAGTSPRRRRVVPAGPVVGDRADVFVRLVERARGRSGVPMLERVDPYGDLILTSEEMPQFLAGLDYLAGLAETAGERDILENVARLAAVCREDATLELHLVGD